MDIAITTERADEKGSIEFPLEVRATAQGSTEEEARANLKALLGRYPDLLNDTRQAADRRVELIRYKEWSSCLCSPTAQSTGASARAW